MIPPGELGTIIDNIGVPYSGINLSYSNSAPIGPADADIFVTMKEGHRPVEEVTRQLRDRLIHEFPGTTFYFLPVDMVGQILNFGLPAPIDVQIVGNDLTGNRAFAEKLLDRMRRVPGIVDLRIQQPFDAPRLFVAVDRTRSEQIGYTQRDVAGNLLVALSGSAQTTPTYWLDPKSGVTYPIAVQAPQYRIQSIEDLRGIPVAGSVGPAPADPREPRDDHPGLRARDRVALQRAARHRHLRRRRRNRPRLRRRPDRAPRSRRRARSSLAARASSRADRS